MTPEEAAARRRAREAALQMLYQCEIGRMRADEAIETYWPARDEPCDPGEELQALSNALVRGTAERVDEIDGLIATRATNWRVERMPVIDRLVLRLAVFELLAAGDTPAKVVINEAIELARTYSGDEAVPFVNGVLDAVRKDLGRE